MLMVLQEDSTVMLSYAKHLDAHRGRPFAAAQGDTVRQLRLMPIEGLHIFYTAECCIASINTLATSGRENSRGGISPICNIWRTLEPRLLPAQRTFTSIQVLQTLFV